MKRIPRDLDALMWQLVEEGNLAALDDFESRFPEFKGELASRLAMVRGLRQAKPAHQRFVEIPRFVAKAPSAPPPRRGILTVGVLGGLAVVALGALTFVVLRPPAREAPKPVLVQPRTPEEPIDTNNTPAGNMDGNTGGQPFPNPPQPIPTEVRKSLRIESAPLYDVLELIAQSFDLVIELAPDMPNPTISLDVQNKTAMEILRDLGREYKFTPLEQGKGEVLLIPAVPFTDPQ